MRLELLKRTWAVKKLLGWSDYNFCTAVLNWIEQEGDDELLKRWVDHLERLAALKKQNPNASITTNTRT